MMATVPPKGKLKVVPETVSAGPPGYNVSPGPMAKAPEGLATIAEPPNVSTGGEPLGKPATAEVPPTVKPLPSASMETTAPLACP